MELNAKCNYARQGLSQLPNSYTPVLLKNIKQYDKTNIKYNAGLHGVSHPMGTVDGQ